MRYIDLFQMFQHDDTFSLINGNVHLLCLQVEIVMGLEEEFGISVEEENAQTIATVQDAADLIESLVEKKSSA